MSLNFAELQSAATALRSTRFQFGRQQAMEQLLTRFTAHGQPPRPVGARFETTLHIFANTEILVLYAVTDGDALRVVCAGAIRSHR